MAFTARVRGRSIQGVLLGRVGADGLLVELTLLIRAFAGLAAFGRAFGAAFIRGRSRPLAWVPVVLLDGAVGLTWAIDEVGSRLVKYSIRATAPRVMSLPRRRIQSRAAASPRTTVVTRAV